MVIVNLDIKYYSIRYTIYIYTYENFQLSNNDIKYKEYISCV
jgi:hypothetical protein